MESMELMEVLAGGDDQCDRSPLLSSKEFSRDLIQLYILKMDNTSFDIRVGSRASVHELKQAVQREFAESQNEEGSNISWVHVWGNFCLTYDHHKLVDDSSSLSSFGIKDNDQLCFARHISLTGQGEKLRSRKHSRPPLFRKKSSTDTKVHRSRNLTQIELHWTHVLKSWLSYSKVWIMGIKQDWKKLRLKD